MKEVKVVVVGNMGVGKSSLSIRFTENKFNNYLQSTLGAAYFEKIHQYGENKKIKFQFWDTAGQQKYKSIAKIYYKDCKIAIAVYDVTNKSSFQGLQSWIDELKLSASNNVIIGIVGNKTDLINEQNQNQCVPYQQVKQYATSIQALLTLVSVKQNKGIKQLFDSIAQRYENHQSNFQTRAVSSIKKTNHNKSNKKCC